MYPFKFESIYIDKIWGGGRTLSEFKPNVPEGSLESPGIYQLTQLGGELY